MLIVWLICAFGFLSQPNMIAANTTTAAIKVTSSTSSTSSTPLTSSTTASSVESDEVDLENAETKDPKKLEIIKQIRKVNTDGSYTVGYEAVDGTFKIESRDVLGNIKGTYGYVDANGEIKRVSYTANNTTNGLKTPTTPSPTIDDLVHIPRQNRTVSSTTRRPPSLAYLMSSTPSPAKINTNIIQATPKRRVLLSSTSKMPLSTAATRKATELTTPTQRTESPTTTVVYATSIHSTASPSSTISTVEQLSKPEKIEINDRFSRVSNVNKLIKGKSENSESETKSERKRGNALRRQLSSDQTETFEAQQQQVYSHASDDESVHTYSGVTGTQRPLFSTTSSPRIPALVLAARNRAAALKNAGLHSSQTSSTTERVYSKPPRRKSERRDENEVSTEPTADNEYLTQAPVALQIPPNQDGAHSSEQEHPGYRYPSAYLPRTRESPRQFKLPTHLQPGFSTTEADSEQFLRESGDGKSSTTASPDQYTTVDLNAATQPIQQSYNPRAPRVFDQHRGADYDARLQQQQSIPLPFGGGPQFGGGGPQFGGGGPQFGGGGPQFGGGGPQFGGGGPQGPLGAGPIGAGSLGAGPGALGGGPGALGSAPGPLGGGPGQFGGAPGPFGGPGSFGGGAPGPYPFPDRPLTARDFERLLNLLVVRNQQYQRGNLLPGLMNQNYFGPGFGNAYGYGYNGYNPYIYNPYQQIPRPPVYNQFDPRYTAYSRTVPPVPPPNSLYGPYSEQENMYQAQQPVEQQLPYMGQNTLSQRMPSQQRRGKYTFNNQPQQYHATSQPEYAEQKTAAHETNQEYLPQNVREELLYRMLLLAIQPDNVPYSPDASTMHEYIKTNAITSSASSTTTTVSPNSKKPVRSVQILGEE